MCFFILMMGTFNIYFNFYIEWSYIYNVYIIVIMLHIISPVLIYLITRNLYL